MALKWPAGLIEFQRSTAQSAENALGRKELPPHDTKTQSGLIVERLVPSFLLGCLWLPFTRIDLRVRGGHKSFAPLWSFRRLSAPYGIVVTKAVESD